MVRHVCSYYTGEMVDFVEYYIIYGEIQLLQCQNHLYRINPVKMLTCLIDS